MSEELSEDEQEKSEEAGFEVRQLQDFIDCIGVMDVLAQLVLPWLEQFRDRRHLSISLRDVRFIRARAKVVKHRLWAAFGEALGRHAALEADSRYALLRRKIEAALKDMRFLK